MLRLSAIVILLLSMLGTASAQSRYRPAYPLFLLRYPSVQKELGLGFTVGKKLAQIQADYERRHMAMISPTASNPSVVRNPSAADLDANAKTADNQRLALLNAKQKVRLKEIGVQYAGGFGLGDPQIGGPLAITPEQQKKLQKASDIAMAAYKKKFNDLTRTNAAKPKESYLATNQMLAQLQLNSLQDFNKVALKILTPTQVARWKQMQGKPFPLGPLFAPIVGAAKSVRS